MDNLTLVWSLIHINQCYTWVKRFHFGFLLISLNWSSHMTVRSWEISKILNQKGVPSGFTCDVIMWACPQIHGWVLKLARVTGSLSRHVIARRVASAKWIHTLLFPRPLWEYLEGLNTETNITSSELSMVEVFLKEVFVWQDTCLFGISLNHLM